MIICAAIKIQVEGLDHETVVPCWRHGKGYEILKDLGYAPKTKYKIIEEGFMNHLGNFLNRKDAYQYAWECGQINAHVRWYRDNNRIPTELYSEDLY